MTDTPKRVSADFLNMVREVGGFVEWDGDEVEVDVLHSDLALDLEAERAANAKLREVCAEAYQMAGALDAPVEALDNLAAAASGKALPHKTFLPVSGSGGIRSGSRGIDRSDCPAATDAVTVPSGDVEAARGTLRRAIGRYAALWESRNEAKVKASDVAVEAAINALVAAARVASQQRVDRPRIVCLCGSTRFYEAFQQANYDETMAGRIVLSVGFYPHSKAQSGHGEGVGHDSTEKVALDELHKRKIDLADEVLVLNVGGYIGDSTRSEIEYARAHCKPVRWLEVEQRWNAALGLAKEK